MSEFDTHVRTCGISVVVRTFKRPVSLKQTLLALLNQSVPSGDFEIIVVDNDRSGSGRETVKAVQRTTGTSIRYYVQPETSNAKTANMGIRHSEGKIVAFVDDDALPDRNWLLEIKERFQKEKTAIIGGRVFLDTKGRQLPSWINGKLQEALGKVDYGDTFRTMKEKEFPVLMNLAARNEIFKIVGLFPEKLGYQAGKPFGGEETAFAIAARKKGYHIYYDPKAIVHHQISRQRFKRTLFLRRKYWDGRANFKMDRMFKPLFLTVNTSCFKVFFVIPVVTGIFLCSLLLSPKKSVFFLCVIFKNLGYVRQAFSVG